MKRARQRLLRRIGHAVVPPALLKYQIAWRNHRRGEPEIRLLPTLVDPAREAVDIGAYTGAYTYFLWRLAVHVHAFEPQPQCAAFLRRAYPRGVSVHALALSNSNRHGSLALPGDAAGASQSAHLLPDDADPAAGARGRPIEIRTLDSFELDNVGFIKIDAEGEERRILEGARATIARCRPVMLIEIEERHVAGDVDAVFRFTESLGYAGFFLHAGSIESLASFSVEDMQRARLRGDRTRPYINNFIFRPR